MARETKAEGVILILKILLCTSGLSRRRDGFFTCVVVDLSEWQGPFM